MKSDVTMHGETQLTQTTKNKGQNKQVGKLRSSTN